METTPSEQLNALDERNRQRMLDFQHGVLEASTKKKQCSPQRGCGRHMPESFFLDTATEPHGYSLCLSCLTARAAEPEAYTEPVDTSVPGSGRAVPASATGRRDRDWRYRISSQYGISPDQYEKISASQAHRCAICQTPRDQLGGHTATTDNSHVAGTPRLVVDHDQRSGKIRGLLCNSCNVLLSNLRGERAIARAAARYLARAPLTLNDHSPGSWPDCRACTAMDQLYRDLRLAPSQEAKQSTKSLKRYYGLDTAQYVHLLIEQKKSCAICHLKAGQARPATKPALIPELEAHGLPRTLVVDVSRRPDASAGQVRGLLCRECHWALGRVNDDPATLLAAAKYIANPPNTWTFGQGPVGSC